MRTKWDELRDRLMAMRVADVKAFAREHGVCLGYAASRKATAVDEIVSVLRYREMEAGDGR